MEKIFTVIINEEENYRKKTEGKYQYDKKSKKWYWEKKLIEENKIIGLNKTIRQENGNA